jgi:hypothetical protein
LWTRFSLHFYSGRKKKKEEKESKSRPTDRPKPATATNGAVNWNAARLIKKEEEVPTRGKRKEKK